MSPFSMVLIKRLIKRKEVSFIRIVKSNYSQLMGIQTFLEHNRHSREPVRELICKTRFVPFEDVIGRCFLDRLHTRFDVWDLDQYNTMEHFYDLGPINVEQRIALW